MTGKNGKGTIKVIGGKQRAIFTGIPAQISAAKTGVCLAINTPAGHCEGRFLPDAIINNSDAQQ